MVLTAAWGTRTLLGDLFQTVTDANLPDFSKLRAIASPIMPRPRNPICFEESVMAHTRVTRALWCR